MFKSKRKNNSPILDFDKDVIIESDFDIEIQTKIKQIYRDKLNWIIKYLEGMCDSLLTPPDSIYEKSLFEIFRQTKENYSRTNFLKIFTIYNYYNSYKKSWLNKKLIN